jgi:hypothetical protein
LWDLWTTKKGFESWWGPEGFHVEVRTLEARVGGALHYEMIADAPEQIEAMKRAGTLKLLRPALARSEIAERPMRLPLHHPTHRRMEWLRSDPGPDRTDTKQVRVRRRR